MLEDVKEFQLITTEDGNVRCTSYMRESAIDNIWKFSPAYSETLELMEEFGMSQDFTTEEVMRQITLSLTLRNGGDEDISAIALKKFTGEIIEL